MADGPGTMAGEGKATTNKDDNENKLLMENRKN